MIEKYEDLLQNMKEDFLIHEHEASAVKAALQWLDENPDQAPGRTITESAFREACEYEDQAHRASSPHTYAERVMFALGITVIPDPDPEPTNVDRLKALYMEWKREGPTALDFAEWMDVRGVKALGGDDD